MNLFASLRQKYSVKELVVITTIIAVIPSVFITLVVSFIFDLDFQGYMIGLLLSTIIPGIVTPTLTYNYLVLFEKLEEAHKLVLFLSRRDDLTGIYNRAYTYELAEREIILAQRHDYPLSVMMIDVDFFKMINDQYGHPVGDDVLIQIVSLIKTEIRDSDILGRYGGEEFVVFLPHSNSQDSYEVAERIRLAVANAPFVAGDETLSVTISIGIKMMDESAQNMDILVSCADKALYAAKQAGRNQVIDADQLLSDSS